jgi:hypothetical protein
MVLHQANARGRWLAVDTTAVAIRVCERAGPLISNADLEGRKEGLVVQGLNPIPEHPELIWLDRIDHHRAASSMLHLNDHQIRQAKSIADGFEIGRRNATG